MNTSPSLRYLACFTGSILFIGLALWFTAHNEFMFGDSDPLWHVAAGDLIRKSGAIPTIDPWSFTAGNYTWFNISWLWDVTLSLLKEYWGWHSNVALNAVFLSLSLTLIYLNCYMHTRNMLISLAVALFAVTLLSFFLRPLQISNVMTALWFFIACCIAHKKISIFWLALLPPLMLVWVNMHGGYGMGLLILFGFFLQSLHSKQHHLSKVLALTGTTCGLATLCTPYGWTLYARTFDMIFSSCNAFIHEWQSLRLTWKNLQACLYALAFILLVPFRKLPLLPVERWLAYIVLVMALASIRNFTLFAIIAAPALACGIQKIGSFLPIPAGVTNSRNVLATGYNRRFLAIFALIDSLLIALWLPTPFASKVYGHSSADTNVLMDEINFIKNRIPNARLLTDFDLGGIIAYHTQGEIKVFIDSRAQSAYPSEVCSDYYQFWKNKPGWFYLMDKYQLDGIIIAHQSAPSLQENVLRRDPGFQEAYKGPKAAIFLRRSPLLLQNR